MRTSTGWASAIANACGTRVSNSATSPAFRIMSRSPSASRRRPPRRRVTLAHDGKSPGTFSTQGRREVESYGGEIVNSTIESVERRRKSFAATNESGSTYDARRLIVSTGFRDELPDIAGLAEEWGRGRRRLSILRRLRSSRYAHWGRRHESVERPPSPTSPAMVGSHYVLPLRRGRAESRRSPCARRAASASSQSRSCGSRRMKDLSEASTSPTGAASNWTRFLSVSPRTA